MNSAMQSIPININLNHGVDQIKDVISYPRKFYIGIKKYSVNGAIMTLAANTWVQCSLAYVAAIVITSNDLSYLSFLTNILNPQVMPLYALFSVILGISFLASFTLQNTCKQKITNEELIKEKIRGGKENEISEIAQNALKIEIIPNISSIKGKKQDFSIIMPILETKRKILENQIHENRNKVFLLTMPYLLSTLIVMGALVKFGFINIGGWIETSSIFVVLAFAVVGVLLAFNELKNNKINHEQDFVLTLGNTNMIPLCNIFIPFRKTKIVSVMNNKFSNKEKNDPISRVLTLLDKHLTDFTNKIVDSFDNKLNKMCTLLDEELLKPANANIKNTLDGIGDNIAKTLGHLKGIREDIKKDLDELCRDISSVLNDAKEFTEKVNSLDVKSTFSKIQNIFENLNNAVKTVKDTIERFTPRAFIGSFASSTQNANENGNNSTEGKSNEFLGMLKNIKEEMNRLKEEMNRLKEEIITGFKKKNEELEKSLEELQNKQSQPSEPDNDVNSGTSANDSLNAQMDEKNQEKEKNKFLKSRQSTEELKKENAKLEEKLSQQKETEEWEEKINGKASDFFDYLLKSINLKIKDTEEKDATLQNFDNKIIIHWKDGSQTTCSIQKKTDLDITPDTSINFVDNNINSAFIACTA